MRRAICAAAAVVALAGVAAGGAFAATARYGGELESDAGSSVLLKVKRHDGDRFVTKFVARELPISCERGTDARLRRASLTAESQVTKKGRFRVRATNEDQVLAIEGKLVGRKAKGTVRYSGLTDVEGRTLECESRKLEWTAERSPKRGR